jgi:hypothetical protein
MKSNIKIFLLCPVPEDQKPINEYINLKENQLTNWPTLPEKSYQTNLQKSFFSTFLFVSVLNFSSITDANYLVNWIIINLLIVTLIFITILLTIFFRWKQVNDRFNQPRLFYEEASWYDGQIWEKPLPLIKNDRLLSSQKIEPILSRLFTTILTFFYLNIVLVILFQF